MKIENPYRKSMEPKAGSLKRSTVAWKTKRRERTKITNIKNERGASLQTSWTLKELE